MQSRMTFASVPFVRTCLQKSSELPTFAHLTTPTEFSPAQLQTQSTFQHQSNSLQSPNSSCLTSGGWLFSLLIERSTNVTSDAKDSASRLKRRSLLRPKSPLLNKPRRV